MHFELVKIDFFGFINMTETFAAFFCGCLSFFPYFENILIDCENSIEFRYDIRSAFSILNLETIFEIGNILYIF